MKNKKLLATAAGALFAFRAFSIEAKLISVTGKVQVAQAGNTWKAAVIGDVLKAGDIIQTGFKSEAVIALSSAHENSKITVAQLSRMTVEQLAEDASGDKTSVYLSAGSVKSEIKKTADHRANYMIRSPVATASVRGTELTVTNAFLSTKIETHEGVVSTWKTQKPMKGPMISSENAESGGLTATESAFKNKGETAVFKGQSASFSPAGKTAPRDAAVKRTSALASATQSMQFLEAVSTSSDKQGPRPAHLLQQESVPPKEFGSASVTVIIQ